MHNERRKRRSSDPVEAVALYLAAAAKQRSFDALALANDSGSIVAKAPSTLNSEALAAVAPFVQNAGEVTDGLLSLVTRGAAYRVWDIDICGEPYYLTAVGGEAFTPGDAEQALDRILS